jgi:hypothetical protein
MNIIKDLWQSRAVMTAFIGLIGVLVLRYTQVPDDVWQSVLALLTVIVAKFTVDDLGLTIGRTIALTMKEMRQKEK